MLKKPLQNEFGARKPLPSEIAAAERMAKKVDSLTLKDDEGNEIGTVGSLYGMMVAKTEKKDGQT